MRGDIPEVALRLSTELPSRTHEARSTYGTETRGGDTSALGKGHGKNGGHNRRSVVIGDEHFPSIREAALALGTWQSTISRMLKDGRARYA